MPGEDLALPGSYGAGKPGQLRDPDAVCPAVEALQGGAGVVQVVGGDGFSIYHGLYGFNAVLCAIAIGGLFFVLTWKSTVYALLAVVFSVPVFAAIAVLLSPIGMPALTAPFVLTTWLFLWPKASFGALQPVALADVTTAENIRASHRVRAAGPSATSEPGEAT
jgi:urea transporter